MPTEPTAPPGRTRAALASAIANGLFAQTAQVLLLRELLVVQRGDELALGLALASWMGWTAVGSLSVRSTLTGDSGPGQPMEGRRIPLCALRYVFILAAAGLLTPAALLAARLATVVLDLPLGVPPTLAQAALLALTIPALPALLTGMSFPLLARIGGVRTGVIYGSEATGALLAGLLLVFILLPNAAPVATASGAGGALLSAAAWLAASQRSAGGATTAVIGTALLALVAVAGPRVDASVERIRWSHWLGDYRLLEVRDSPYGRYALLARSGQASLFLDGRHVCDVPDPQGGAFTVHTTLLQVPRPRRVLLVGNAVAGGAREALRHRPQQIDCVEIDWLGYRMLRRHVPAGALAALADPRVRRHEQDPLAFLAATSQRYDAIVVDLPDPQTLGLARFYSLGFFRLAAAHLRDGGALAVTLGSQENYLGPAMLARNALVYRTLRHVFDDVLATPGDTCLLLARRRPKPDRPLTLDADVLYERMRRRGIDAPAYAALLFADAFPPMRVALINASLHAGRLIQPDPLAEAAPQPVGPPASVAFSTNVRPRAYWYTRLLDLVRYEPRWLPVVVWLPRVVPFALGLLVVGLLLAARGPASPRATRRQLSIVVFTAGFSGMAAQTLVLLGYQCRAGTVYVGIALLTAAFMAGLAGGSLIAARLGTGRIGLRAACPVLVPLALAPLVLLSTPPVAVRLVAGLLALIIGAGTGAVFSLATRVWPGDGAARSLYAADLLGAMLSVLCVTLVLLPALGQPAAAAMAAIFALLAGLAARMPRATG